MERARLRELVTFDEEEFVGGNDTLDGGAGSLGSVTQGKRRSAMWRPL
jgi:hypothetical protein